jgi:hypothetical protein
MDPAGSAQRLGIPFSMHSDASVTPVDPLFCMWTATARKTMSGRVLGEEERITVPQALHAVTLGAAYLLGQDDKKGSIKTGKLANFHRARPQPARRHLARRDPRYQSAGDGDGRQGLPRGRLGRQAVARSSQPARRIDQIAVALLEAATLGILRTERIVARRPVGIGPVGALRRIKDAVAPDPTVKPIAASAVADRLPRHLYVTRVQGLGHGLCRRHDGKGEPCDEKPDHSILPWRAFR